MHIRNIIFSTVLTLVGLQSCTTDKFDLGKDMELQVHFADDGFSLGGTNSADVPLSQVIELSDSGQLCLDADSNYLFKKVGDDMKPSEVIVGTGSLCQGTDQTFEYHFKNGGSTSMIPGRPGFYTMKFEKSLAVDYNPDTQGESVIELHYVNTSATSQGVTSYMTIVINTTFNEVSEFTENVKLTYQVPSFYDLVDESELTETLKYEDLTGEHSHSIRVKGVNFLKKNLRDGEAIGLDKTTHKIIMKGEVKVSGESVIYLADYNATSDPFLKAHVQVGSMGVDKVTGVFNSWQDITIDPITFDNLPAFIRDDEVVVDVENPIVSLTLKNEVPSRVQMDADMYGIKNNKQISELHVGESYGTDVIEFEGADPDVEGDSKTTTVWISRIPTQIPDTVSKNVVVSNMMDLIRKIPDRVDVKGRAHTNPNDTVTLTLGKVYKASPSYVLEAPLKMGPNMKIVYKKEMEDLHDDLEDTNIGELLFNADATNNIPLELSLKVYPIDVKGDTLTSIQIITPDPIPGNQKKNVTFRLINTSDNQMANVDRIVVKAYALSGKEMEGKLLNAKQNLRLENVKITIKDSSITL